MNFYMLPASEKEIAEFEKQQRQREQSFNSKIDSLIHSLLHSE